MPGKHHGFARCFCLRFNKHQDLHSRLNWEAEHILDAFNADLKPVYNGAILAASVIQKKMLQMVDKQRSGIKSEHLN